MSKDKKQKKQVTAPVDKTRQKVFREMTPQLQKIARDGEARLSQTAAALVIAQYDLGSRLKKVYADEATYGSDAATQLAAYWAIPGGATTLYHMKNLAERFDRDFVGQWSAKEMASGARLTFGHWIKLTQVKDEKHIEPLLKRCFADSLTVRDLEAAIVEIGAEKSTKRAAGAGRKQSAPKSPMAGLQKTHAAAQSFSNMVPVMEKSVFTAIDTMSPDNIDDVLLKRLKDTRDQVASLVKAGQTSLKHIESNIARVERVLEKKKTEAKTEAVAEKAEKKAKVKAKGKKKKDKKKRRTPVAVD